MGKDSLTLLYNAGQLKYIKVQQWYSDLVSQKDVYAQCYVVSFTRVKNLGSKYMHEYVQFIVEDRSSGDRMRVYAERMNEQDIDMVSIGRDEKAPRNWDELPLPLTSIAYRDQAKQPSLLDVAKILNSTSVIGGGYTFYDKNCFWFAFTTFDVLRVAFKGELKNWSWINTGGSGGGGFKDAWGLGLPTMFKFAFKSTAKGFETEREDNMNWLTPSETRSEVTATGFVDAVQATVLTPEFMDAYIQWAGQAQFELDHTDVEAIASQTVAKVSKLDSEGALNWTKDFDSSVADLTYKVSSDPDAEKYLSMYQNQATSDVTEAETGLSTPSADGPGNNGLGSKERDYQDLVRNLHVLAGKVLLEAGLGSSS